MVHIMPLNDNDSILYDAYVKKHSQSTLYHLFYFKRVIEQTYHHRSYYYVAFDDKENIVGIMPLFLIRSIFLGNSLVSLPFCDYGGVLADTSEISGALFQKAVELSKELKADEIELRQTKKTDELTHNTLDKRYLVSVKTEKVRMLLTLPDSSETLFSSFPAKLRSQIRKPQKEGCVASNGGVELLDDFYDVFTHNMRDLGSPVHPKSLMRHMLLDAPDQTRLFVVYHNKRAVACSLVGGYKDVLVNPWASFKRSSQRIAPNMLLYWEMLQYAITNKYRYFDFGRSTFEEGTYKFKAQWGAVPEQLFWYNYCKDNSNHSDKKETDKSMFIRIWKKLPLPLTQVLGPVIRKQIHL